MEFPNASEYSFNEKKSFHKTRDIVYIDPECVVFMFWRQSVQCSDSTTHLERTIYGVGNVQIIDYHINVSFVSSGSCYTV